MSLVKLLNWGKSLGSSFSFTSIAVLISSVVVLSIYALIVDFFRTFLKVPKHFRHETWKNFFIKPKAGVPTIELGEGGSYREVLARGSQLYPDRAYKVKHFPHEIVILPYKDIGIVRNTSESKLSFQQASYDFFLGQLTGMAAQEHAITEIVREGITKLLDRVYDVVDTEVIGAITTEIGICEEWTNIVLLPKVVRMITSISQRVFVGEPLCRDEKWIQCITNCTLGAFQSIPNLWNCPWYLRPFVAWRHPALRGVRRSKEEARRLLKPVLERRLKDMEKPDFKSPPDFIQLVLEGTGGAGRSLSYQVNAQVGMGRVALFTTSLTVMHLLHNLATHSEYIEPLRQEVLHLGNVAMSRINVAKLAKMDSFIRECLRLDKFMLVGTIRKVLSPITLSDGTVLPEGAILGIDTHEAVFNQSRLERPEVFDGMRFFNLRTQSGNEQKYQAVTPGPDYLVFGYGAQACPGRFFGLHEAKVLLARILVRYKFKLADPTQNPVGHTVGILVQANPQVEFLFKSRPPSS